MSHDELHSANPGFASAQLDKALTTAETHEDAAVRQRAVGKSFDWNRIMEAMLSGSLKVGSRTPVNAPAWVTLKVMAGGFATGDFLAGGELEPHEQSLASDLGTDDRLALNAYWFSEAGFAKLFDMLDAGTYRVNVPEEGASLVVAWLLKNGHWDEAAKLVEELRPLMPRLRFYPVPTDAPMTSGTCAHVQTVGDVITNLQKVRTPAGVTKMKDTIKVWNPLYDQVVALFAETVEDDWPCQHYPEGWSARAVRVLEEYRTSFETLRMSPHERSRVRRPVHRRVLGRDARTPRSKNLTFLVWALDNCVRNPHFLSGFDVGKIRKILHDIERKRGLPGSEKLAALRAEQAAIADRPSPVLFASVLVDRLSSLDQRGGLDNVDAALASITGAEASSYLPEGTEIPGQFERKLSLCLDAPLDVLVDKGIITSGEVLAKVTPQVSAAVHAAGIEDPSLRRLFGAIYQAFRNRRSLLLLNLEHQVRFEELPWVKVLEPHRKTLGAEVRMWQTLNELVVLAITAFPAQILPNKLISELSELCRSARRQLPLVEEVATDIFMGTFSAKFLKAAKTAAGMLQGTTYERYYGLPYAEVLAMEAPATVRWGRNTSAAFDELCFKLAGEQHGRWLGPAANGKVVEQEQILTTHNLAVLFDALDLRTTLGRRLEQLPRQCFQFVVEQQQIKIDDWRSRLQMVKNTAYAWRQMVFFLSLLPEEAVRRFVRFADEHLAAQPKNYRDKFIEVLDGLWFAIEGVQQKSGYAGPLRFLGWTTGEHWLLPPRQKRANFRRANLGDEQDWSDHDPDDEGILLDE